MEVQAEIQPVANTTQEVDTTGATAEGQVPESQQQATGENQADSGNGLDYANPEATKAEIERLRKENAKYRTRSKERDSEVQNLNERYSKIETGLRTLFGGEKTELTPEQQLQELQLSKEELQVRNEQLEVQTALRDAAFEYQIPKDQFEYFEFLVGKRLNSLEDGEEITEDDLQEIATMARGQNASSNTSVNGEGQQMPNPVGGETGITVEDFSAMSIMEKSKLYGQDPKLYERLKIQEAAGKKR